jgi:CheY-like chemotaxis protein
MNTLLIDDDPLALKLLARQSERLGCAGLMLCPRAEEAMTLLQARPEAIELVFCDLQMPDIDGVEFVRHLAGVGYGGSLVLVSGEDGRILNTVARLARAHRIHVIGALKKPIKNEQLIEVLASHAGRKAMAQRAARGAFGPVELERAIAGGELINHYQPKVALASGVLHLGQTPEVEGVLSAWFDRHQCRAALVRPDHYVFGTCQDASGVNRLLSEARRQLSGA